MTMAYQESCGGDERGENELLIEKAEYYYLLHHPLTY